jgi:hypothetical protein
VSGVLTLREVRDLCGLYGIDESTSVELVGLARGAHEQIWWSQYENINLDPYLALEQMATAITSYATYYVPGLLQTKEYSRAIIKAIAPKMNPDIYQQRVEVRMRRQQVLEEDNRPRYRLLLDEAVLRCDAGGPRIMVAQIDKSWKLSTAAKWLSRSYLLTLARIRLRTATSCCWNLTKSLIHHLLSSSRA